jgi:hypothetical protein
MMYETPDKLRPQNLAITKRWSSSSSSLSPKERDPQIREIQVVSFELDSEQVQSRTKHRPSTRSWSQQGRLWLLQSKTSILLWKRLIVILCSLSVSSWSIYHHHMEYTTYNDNKMPNPFSSPRKLGQEEDVRQLFHKLPFRYRLSVPIPQPVEGSVLLDQAGFGIKPVMIGILWPSQESGDDDYYIEKNDVEGFDFREGVAVVIDPKDYSLLKVNSVDIRYKAGGRRSITAPNYHQIFQPSNDRKVTFDINYQESINPNFEETDEGMAWPLPEGCERQYEWETESYPTCNNIHEQDIVQQLSSTMSSSSSMAQYENSVQAELLAAGGYRNVWMIHNGTQLSPHDHENPVALKTLLYERDWYQVQFERHNLDALASMQLQASPYILNLYGYCGTSGMYEFAKGGNLKSYEKEHRGSLDSRAKMELAYNVVAAIADLHNFVKEDQPWIAHTDIYPDQFVRVQESEGIFKLNDFNRARWIHLHNETKEHCGFTFPRNRGKFRSPEEYAYQPETEAVDIFSMGNILYVLTIGEYPFHKRSRDTVKSALKRGKRQKIPEEYKNSSDPLIQALLKAIEMCWIQNPQERATARQVEQFLYKAKTKKKKRANTHRI